MNKKTIIVSILVLFCAGGWWKSQPGTSLSLSKTPVKVNAVTDILADDQQKLERNINKEVLADEFWPQINDYTKNAKSMVDKNNAKAIFKITQGAIKDLATCLKKDFCGMERRNDNDAYFDDVKTPGHILLGRNLDIMIEALQVDPDLKKELEWELIRELTENENEKIQVLALEIIKDFDQSGADTDKLLEIADNFKGNAKAEAFAKIASRDSLNTENNRILLVNALEKSFSGDDPNTVISVVEKMNKMRLSESEIAKVSRNLCHFKENGSDDPNWKMIKYDMAKVADLDKICN